MEKCEEIKKQIEEGSDFVEMARQHSKCPSGQRGGGDFGYHLIEITSRSD